MGLCRKKSVDGGYVLGVEWVWEYAMEKGRGISPRYFTGV